MIRRIGPDVQPAEAALRHPLGSKAKVLLTGVFGPTVLVLSVFLAISVTLRSTDHPTLQAVGALGNWTLLIAFVALYAMQLGGIGESISNSLPD